MEIHMLEWKHFITFFNRKLPSSYTNYPNQVDKCKCEQQGRIIWNSFVFRLSHSSFSVLVCGPLELLIVFVLFPSFSVSCYLSFVCCFIFVIVTQPDNNVYKIIKQTNSCKAISWLITSKKRLYLSNSFQFMVLLRVKFTVTSQFLARRKLGKEWLRQERGLFMSDWWKIFLWLLSGPWHASFSQDSGILSRAVVLCVTPVGAWGITMLLSEN